MVDYKDLGRRIRILRHQNDLTQEELAEQLNISASFLGHIERGTRIASLDTLVTLCNVLKVSPQMLLIASLDDELTDHIPTEFSPENRNRLSSFLRMACDVLEDWDAP